ncbi:MAG: HEAT repeat domain-containing protein [Candidatus Anammoximicrobium sp.]|nr:HEAT repeat domain-containing protein [Candidatus Anammoximicrobium sp.]
MNLKLRLLSAAAAALNFLSLCVLQAGEANHRERLQVASELRERCLATLRQGLASDEFWPSMHAAEALTLAGHGREVVAALRDRLPQERDDQRRCGLARELVRAGERGPLSVLLEILGNEQSNGRVHAAESLFKIGEAGDGQRLRAALETSPHPPLQLMAAAALAKSGDQAGLRHLRERLHSDDRPIRRLAAWALARLGGEPDVPRLRHLLADEPDATARVMIAGALACLGHAAGRAELGRNLDSDDAGVRAMAAEFVGLGRGVEFQAKLVQLLDDRTLDARLRAAQSLLALSQPAAKDKE